MIFNQNMLFSMTVWVKYTTTTDSVTLKNKEILKNIPNDVAAYSDCSCHYEIARCLGIEKISQKNQINTLYSVKSVKTLFG